ncbi:putative nucleic acid-binding protein [Xenococcus sp. PCC 7305]|uniref:type II toxin-antitoxin system VapC family toxin n=1 Tax=Xenococcus sp. PCC 7305 TaxID=102125 RepID=UPI0002AC26CF|nr:type II toxin-antitoxin system VapC family toxin [Xenococcus sp. PCC 7305]ELS01716.1 putative nucleic acid-binding protein [Xenococcus sp. PCC 7305]
MSDPLRCVIDANVGIKRFIADPLSAKTKQLLDTLSNPQTEIFIPDLFYIEIANIFWKYVRAELYSADQVQIDLDILKRFPFKVISTSELMGEAVNLAINFGISAYDACYVALSRRVNAPLLTLDKKLIKALVGSSLNLRSFVDFTVP